jgi:hypothetical protein
VPPRVQLRYSVLFTWHRFSPWGARNLILTWSNTFRRELTFRFASTDLDQRQAHQSPIMSTKFLQKVVKNDAMKSDPPEIYGWRVYALAVSACFGGMIFVSASRTPKAASKSSCCS